MHTKGLQQFLWNDVLSMKYPNEAALIHDLILIICVAYVYASVNTINSVCIVHIIEFGYVNAHLLWGAVLPPREGVGKQPLLLRRDFQVIRLFQECLELGELNLLVIFIFVSERS